MLKLCIPIVALALLSACENVNMNFQQEQDANSVIVLQSTTESISTEELSKKPKKSCIRCGGKYYCITSGCANTPCGWICSH